MRLAPNQKADHDSAMTQFRSYMPQALAQARAAMALGEVPVGAVVVSADGHILGAAGNRTRQDLDPSAHAEILAIRHACAALGQDRLINCDLFVTLEPCAMCAGAIAQARIARLYFGAFDPKSGGIEQGPRVFEHPQTHHAPEVYAGIAQKECENLLAEFFADLRGAKL